MFQNSLQLSYSENQSDPPKTPFPKKQLSKLQALTATPSLTTEVPAVVDKLIMFHTLAG